jgi:hypothetical protein
MGLSIGKTYTVKGIGTFKVQKATAKGKAKSAVLMKNGKPSKTVNFGDPNMSNAPNTKRGDNYCSRSRTLNTFGFNANTLSRLDWNCKGAKSTDEAVEKVMDYYKDSCNKGCMYDSADNLVKSWDSALALMEQGEYIEIRV